MAKKPALGRGLSSLIPETPKPQQQKEDQKYIELDLDRVDPNPEQPRRKFDQEHLRELAESIRHNGIIQPIIVSKRDNRFILIAGERRWRASQLAGLEKIPAVIKETDEDNMLTLSLLENIQREELNAIEEAQAYQSLIERHNFTHELLAERLGKSRVTISNTIRLLKLQPETRDLIEDGKLSFGHARCLVGLNDPEREAELVALCLQKGWSVRQLEAFIKSNRENTKKSKQPKKPDVFIKNAELELSKTVGTKVAIKGTSKKGKLMIPYTSEDELQRIYEWIMREDKVEA